MLVINANNAQEWFILSNSQLWIYPDLRANLFLSLDTLFYQTENSTPATTSAIETIWGTNINRYSARFLMPEYLTWLSSWDACPIWILSWSPDTSYHAQSIRIWLEYWFVGGEIVWEEIVWGWIVSMAASLSTLSNVKCNSVIFTIQLLHTDWTLTQIATKTYISTETGGGWSATNIWNALPSWNVFYTDFADGVTTLPEKTTQTWTTANAGDRLVLDISYSMRKSTSWAQPLWLFFGYKYTSEDRKRFTPTQVSIR